MYQKLFVILVVALLIMIKGALPTYAQTPFQLNPASGDTWTAFRQTGFGVNGLLMVFGTSMGLQPPPGEENTTYGSDGKIYTTPRVTGGAVGSVVGGLTALYSTPPTSTVFYLADLGKRTGIIPPAYAQTESVPGSGSSILQPILTLWTAARNISYLGFVLVFMIVGFMIMLRSKLNPQTVVSAQAALPGLAIGLILVTFSYFIASLIVDIAFFGTQFVVSLFTINGTPNVFGANPEAIQAFARNANIFDLFKGFYKGPLDQDVMNASQNLLEAANPLPIPANLTTGVIGAVVGVLLVGLNPFGLILGLFGLAAGGAAPVTVSLILPIILVIALFIQMLRLLMGLISSYIQLLIATIAGPFAILISAIPGRGPIIGLWWRTILGNALVFPAVIASFLFAGALLMTDNTQWVNSPPLFGNLSPSFLRLLISYGIVLGTPAVPGMVRQALGVKSPATLVAAAVQGFTGGSESLQDSATTGFRTAVAPWEGVRQQYKSYNEAHRAGDPRFGAALPAPDMGSGPIGWLGKQWVTRGKA